MSACCASLQASLNTDRDQLTEVTHLSVRHHSVLRAALVGGKAIDDSVVVDLPRAQLRRTKVRMVGRVREDLRLEHEGITLAIGVARPAHGGAVEEVARIELQAWLARIQAQDAPAGGRFHLCHEARFGTAGVADHPVHVVTLADQQLTGMAIADVLADGFGMAEIEWRARYRLECSGRDLRLV